MGYSLHARLWATDVFKSSPVDAGFGFICLVSERLLLRVNAQDLKAKSLADLQGLLAIAPDGRDHVTDTRSINRIR